MPYLAFATFLSFWFTSTAVVARGMLLLSTILIWLMFCELATSLAWISCIYLLASSCFKSDSLLLSSVSGCTGFLISATSTITVPLLKVKVSVLILLSASITWLLSVRASGVISSKTKSAPFICTPFTFCSPVPTLIVLFALPLSVALTSDCWLTPFKSKLTLIVSKVPLNPVCLVPKSKFRLSLACAGLPSTVKRPAPSTCLAKALLPILLSAIL